MNPFDTAMSLEGMIPSIQRNEKDFGGKINEIQTHEFIFSEL